MENAKPFYLLDELPKDDDPFWGIVNSPHLSNLVNFQIINELRKFDPVALSDAQCRTQLGKLKGLQELLDLPVALKKKDEKPLETNEEFPS